MARTHIKAGRRERTEDAKMERGGRERGAEREGTDKGWRGRKRGRKQAVLKEDSHPDLHTSVPHHLSTGPLCFAGQSLLL